MREQFLDVVREKDHTKIEILIKQKKGFHVNSTKTIET